MSRSPYADRAAAAYADMQATFRARSGLYRRDGRFHVPGAAAHLWPFIRAAIATFDLAGVADGPVPGFDADAAIADRLAALQRYWDARIEPPAYASDVVGSWFGGDRYYDDNAWVGLALVQLQRMRPGGGHLERAGELLRFAGEGWDRQGGGVFWVEQGRGTGARNHDRNTCSTAPTAQLALHVAELTGAPARAGEIGVCRMYGWVLQTLDSGGDGSGLFWDKLRGDGTIDRALWSYNQGSMIGLNVLMARIAEAEPTVPVASAGGEGPPARVARGERPAVFLARSEEIARRALRHYASSGYERQPPAFNAILFRNLLLLHAATGDQALRDEIIAAMRGYADALWDARGRPRRGTVTLLDQSGLVQVLALLAWDPAAYGLLA